MVLLSLALILVTCWILWYIKKEWGLSKRVPPGPLRLPGIGNLLQLATNRHRKVPYVMFRDFCQIYGPITFLQMGVNYQVVIEDYETIRDVLCNDIWVDRFYDDLIAQRAFGKKLGVLIVSGDVWKEMRRFSLRTLRDFGFGKQKSMDATIQEELTELMAQLHAPDTQNPDGTVVDMHQFFTISILNILWNMIAGFRFSHSDTRLVKMISLMERVIKENSIGSPRTAVFTAFPFLRHISKLTQGGKNIVNMYSTTHAFFLEFLEKRRAEGHYKEEQRDFIDVFLHEIDAHAHLGDDDDKNYYTDEQFQVLVHDLFAAGSETTSNTMEFAILYMILNTDVQAKVQAEIDHVVGTSRFPTILDKTNLPYTEATLLEIQRMANVVPIVVRSPNKETMIGKYFIPQGTIGIINLHSMHMSDKYWDQPHLFKPERFYDPSTNTVVNAHKILPFGIGKRICLGEVLARTTLFTYFATFLQQYTFSRVSTSDCLSMEATVGFTLSPKPYQAVVKQRLS